MGRVRPRTPLLAWVGTVAVSERKTAPRPADAERRDAVLDQEPVEIGERGAGVGEERLSRSGLDILVTGVIGGIEVFFGGMAGAAVIGGLLTLKPDLPLYTALSAAALVFPVGFVFVILGRSELFTENFLIPVVAVLSRRARPRQLVTMWTLAWLGNMAGCAVLAVLVLVPHTLGDPIITGYARYAAYKLSVPALGTFVSAILAGAIMTVLTWLLLAIRSPIVKVFAIFAAGYTLFATNVSHAIVGSALIFVGFSHTSHSILDVARWVGLATAGNLAGGVGLVTMFRTVQIWEKTRRQ